MSNGGGFVNAIACNAVGGEFAALASGSGAYYAETGWGDACSPARTPLPIFSIHGGNDKSVYYDGGEGSGGQLPAISDWLEDWATRNECVDKKVEDSFEGDVHHFSWTCGDTGEGVQQHWKIDSMGKSPILISAMIVPTSESNADMRQVIAGLILRSTSRNLRRERDLRTSRLAVSS